MENAPSNNEASSGTSALDDGLGVSLPPDCKFYFSNDELAAAIAYAFQCCDQNCKFYFSNDELAAAIAYAFQCCDQKYVGGYTTGTTEPGKAMLEHLKALLTAQKIRAGMIETPNLNSTTHDVG